MSRLLQHALKWIFYLHMMLDGAIGTLTLGFYPQPYLSRWIAELLVGGAGGKKD